jgi:hypothetical protein
VTLIAKLREAEPGRALITRFNVDYSRQWYDAAVAADGDPAISVGRKWQAWDAFEAELPDERIRRRAWFSHRRTGTAAAQITLAAAIAQAASRKDELMKTPHVAIPGQLYGSEPGPARKRAIQFCRQGPANADALIDGERCKHPLDDGIPTFNTCETVPFVVEFWLPEAARSDRLHWEIVGRGIPRESEEFADMRYVPGCGRLSRDPGFYRIEADASDAYLRHFMSGFNPHRRTGEWELRILNDTTGALMGSARFSTENNAGNAPCTRYYTGSGSLDDALEWKRASYCSAR